MMLAALATAIVTQGSPVTLDSKKVGGVLCRVVRVDARHPKVRIDVLVPQGFPGSHEEFSTILKRYKPKAAINGAYFDKGTLKPIGDIVVGGQVIHSGRMGTAFTISQDGTLNIMRVIRHKTMRWEGFRTVLACGPALMLKGRVDVRFEEEGFRDPHVTGKAQRMALGITGDGKVLLVHMQKAVSFEEEANVMRSLGCREAMNLDAGASLGMAFEGKVLVNPSRKLTNVLGVFVAP